MDLMTEEIAEATAAKTGSVTAFEYTPKPVYDFFKRVFDIVVSILCLTVGLPFMLIIAAAIMIDDFGNPIFVQKRIGKNGKEFPCLKWRTMYVNADEKKIDLEKDNEYNAVHFKLSNDPRVTRVGKFLRKTSLDETLQAVNILLNHMSVIGPRPFIPSEQEQLPDKRLVVKPGLSCYWQIANTAKMPIEEQLELDYKYIRERSFLTDIKIIFRTIGVVLGHKNY
ncbi:MAG: sugar transferase [Oscillospiraceae bacterium]